MQNIPERFKALQSIQLEILQYLDRFTKKHNIKYYLVFGTLLGAVRHHGFIPWDIDIDVSLMRDDYERLLNLLREEKNAPYFVSTPGDKYHTSPHALLYCKNTMLIRRHSKYNKRDKRPKEVYIDLFPIDYLPTNQKDKTELVKRLARLRRIVDIKTPTFYKPGRLYRFLKTIRSFRYFFISNEHILSRYNKLMMKHNNELNSKMGQFASDDFMTISLEMSDYGEPLFERFEHLNMPIPRKYDTFLRQVYGNYMELPEKDKQEEYFNLDFEVFDNRINE